MTSPRRLLLTSVLALALVTGCLSGDADPEDAQPAGAGTPDGSPGEGGTSGSDGGDDPGADESAPDSGTDAVTGPAAHVEVLQWNGTITEVAVGVFTDAARLCCAAVVVDGENMHGTFAASGNVTGLVVELVWDDPQWDLDLGLQAPDHATVFPPQVNETGISSATGHAWSARDGTPGAPDGHAVIRVEDPEVLALDGEWTWTLSSKTAIETPFTVFVSVLHDAVPEEGYSAVGEA